MFDNALLNQLSFLIHRCEVALIVAFTVFYLVLLFEMLAFISSVVVAILKMSQLQK